MNNYVKKDIVIYHSEFGIYLGNCMGMARWSKLDPMGQDAAITFPSEEDAEAYITTCLDNPVKNCQFVEVKMDTEEIYASVESCKKAGLPEWDPDT